ncbi:RNA polymerase sigma factor [Streptomyces clavuligerus]|uniref:Sigma-70 n=1 Tax=Streptomyces clavuligerus TaxID=1901 RepID=D5SJP4_STRCL|nr:sigma-70 family RNA polymerase sigma factor [Streptomyces clavuligerus]EFG04137.1 Sigma-70 [Streptomyces clavuligerus]MBY6307382.1 sigma-70 family RNA polymerase sigma factor [Streptomyces clavuligerus]QCS10055.1 sigma-70 family RNA polymerase sigma factor [Streptomyces clavuligerus]QPJ97901.1 sigma-70 family RNA polymerase sigma factor [Streptomyces clavuligerus]WDN56761.1 sigma-70 family RNA polymerase sigma factor [Streptomyces clavuligerus]
MNPEPVGRARDFETFFAGAQPRLLAQAIMLCGHREDAEDAVQEGFAEAYRAWDRISGYELPEAWVYRIAVQRLWKTYRRRRAGQDRLPDLPVPVQAGPERAAEAREVLRLLAALPPRQRVTMVLFCLHGWSQQDIAEALRMTRGGVAANVSKARRTLKEALGMTDVELSGREAFMVGPGRGERDRIRLNGLNGLNGLDGLAGVKGLNGPGRGAADPVDEALRDTEAWLRAALLTDPGEPARARAALARRLGERP